MSLGRLRRARSLAAARSGSSPAVIAAEALTKAVDQRRPVADPKTRKPPAPPFLGRSKPPQRHSRASPPSPPPVALIKRSVAVPLPLDAGSATSPGFAAHHRLSMTDIGLASITGAAAIGSDPREHPSAEALPSTHNNGTGSAGQTSR